MLLSGTSSSSKSSILSVLREYKIKRISINDFLKTRKNTDIQTFIKLIINISLLFGSGYGAKKLLFDVEKVAVKRIKKGFSSSEVFSRKLTGTKLPF